MMSHNEPNLEVYERERIVFQSIQNNPELHHNALIKQIVPKFMAKTTFEKTRDSLLEKEIIFVTNRGNKKFYFLTKNYEKNRCFSARLVCPYLPSEPNSGSI